MGWRDYFLAWNRFLRRKKTELNAADVLHSADKSFGSWVSRILERRERRKRIKKEVEEMMKFEEKLRKLKEETSKKARDAELARKIGKYHRLASELEYENFRMFYDPEHVRWDEAELLRELGIDFFNKIRELGWGSRGERERKRNELFEKYNRILRKYGIEGRPEYDVLMRMVDHATREYGNFRASRNRKLSQKIGSIPKDKEKRTLEDVLKSDIDEILWENIDVKETRKLEKTPIKDKVKEYGYRILGSLLRGKGEKYKQKAEELRKEKTRRLNDYLKKLKSELNEYRKKIGWETYATVTVGEERAEVKRPRMVRGKIEGERELIKDREKFLKHTQILEEILKDPHALGIAYHKAEELKKLKREEELEKLQRNIEEIIKDYIDKL